MADLHHTTIHEMDFIGKIGSFTASGKAIARHSLLRNYLNSCQKRVLWGEMDKNAIIKFAEAEFGKEVW